MIHDFLVIGGGIVGLSSAMQLQLANPGASVLVLEKEAALARHQTGRNSGVIHAGVYYAPGSLKARFCRDGAEATVAFCQEHGIPYDRCGKLLVATNPLEVERMAALQERCVANGIEVEPLDGDALREREPHVTGLAGLFVPATGIVDYGEVARAMAAVVRRAGGEIHTGEAVTGIVEASDRVTVETGAGRYEARTVVACAGVWADRIAKMAGLDLDFRIVPFRGEYYRLPPARDHIVKHLIYPIPDPALPFLGVHLTRMIGGYVTVGPNAVLSFAREGYHRTSFNAGDVAAMAGFGGFWKMAAKNLRSAWDEQLNSLSKRRYLALCRKYCPELTVDDLQPYRAGVRAQAVMADGSLMHDFLIRTTPRTIHICNAPSPAATSAIPIGRYIAGEAARLAQAFA